MSSINFLKPDRTNLNTFLYLGSFLFFISILDVFLNSFFRLNLTGFLPNFLSFLLPLILGFVGLYFIGGLRNYRLRTLRHEQEVAHLEKWLTRVADIHKQPERFRMPHLSRSIQTGFELNFRHQILIIIEQLAGLKGLLVISSDGKTRFEVSVLELGLQRRNASRKRISKTSQMPLGSGLWQLLDSFTNTL